MFILVLLEDIVRIPPEEFSSEADAIHFQVNQKYANKVIENVGLCIEVYDILEISQGTVYAGDGAAFAKVRFRMIVFKPFLGELITATIKSMDQHGIILTLDFFDQILIPPSNMQQPSKWNGSRWFWSFAEQQFWMSVGDQVRVRVEKLVFNPPESKRVAIAEKKAAAAAVQAVMEHPPEATKEDDQKEAEKPKDKEKDELNTSLDELDVALHRVALEPSVLFKGRPMYIIVRSNESGLGLTSWWLEAPQVEAGAEEEGETGEMEGVEYEEGEGDAVEGVEEDEEGLVHGEPEEVADTGAADVEDGN